MPELNTSTDFPNVDYIHYSVIIFNYPKRLNSNKEYINDEEDELYYIIKFHKLTNKPIISILRSNGTIDTALIPTLKCLIFYEIWATVFKKPPDFSPMIILS
ncbi:hypothetical protein ACTFIW_000975 [Dictyostelium discoideum]